MLKVFSHVRGFRDRDQILLTGGNLDVSVLLCELSDSQFGELLRHKVCRDWMGARLDRVFVRLWIPIYRGISAEKVNQRHYRLDENA